MSISRENDMRIGSSNFDEYGRRLAFSAQDGHRVRSRRDARRERLKKTIADLPWTIPEPPATQAGDFKKSRKYWSL